MADEGLLMEARLKDFISSNLKTIETNLRNFSDVSKRELAKQTENNNQLNRSIGQVKGSWDVLGIATKQFIAIAGGLAIFTKIKSYLGECTSEIMKQVDAEAQLESAIGYSSRALLNYADQIQQTTTFEDDAVLQAQSRIASFIKEEDSIKAVTKAAVDFAAAKRIDVVTAADLLTKSIVSGTNALSRYGIRIKDTNIVEERMKSAIEGVNKAYGGRAEALAKTDSGKIQQTNNLINEQKELIGKELLPVMREWYSMMLNLTQITVKPLTDAFKGWSWLLGGDKKAKAQLDELNTFNKEMTDLMSLQREWTTIQQTQLALQKQGGSLFNPETLREANNNIKVITQSMKDLAKERNTAYGITKTTTTTTTGKEDTESKARSERQIKAQQEMVNAFWKNYNDLRIARETNLQKIADIENEFNNESLRAEQEKFDSGISLHKAYADRYMQIADDINSKSLTGRIYTINEQVNNELTLWKYYYNNELISYKQYEDMKTLITKQASQDRIKNILSEVDQFKSQYVDPMLGSWQSYLSAKRNSEYQAQVEKIKNMNLSQKQEEALLKKAEGQNKLAARKDQNIAVGQALINGALAITNALTVKPWPLAIAASALATATSAFQVATIKRQQFAKGGVVDTFLGEQGSEYVSNYGMVNKPTFASLPVGTRVYNNTETKNMFGGSTVVLNIPAGTPIDSRAADRIEDAARWIGDALVKAKREGRLVRFESMV